MERLRGLLRKVRAVLGLGAVGAIGGALLGAGWTLVGNLIVAGGMLPVIVGLGALVWGTFGAFVAIGFGIVLGAIGDEIVLEELPLWQAGLFGAGVGSVFPTAVLYLLSGTLLNGLFPALPAVAALCGALGALTSCSLVGVAKYGDRLLGRGQEGDAPLVESGDP